MYRPEDKELWDIVYDLPRLPGVWPYVVFILSIVLPGSGTILAACIGTPSNWSKTQLFIGSLQMMTAFYLIGWIWSIWWGWKMLFFTLR